MSLPLPVTDDKSRLPSQIQKPPHHHDQQSSKGADIVPSKKQHKNAQRKQSNQSSNVVGRSNRSTKYRPPLAPRSEGQANIPGHISVKRDTFRNSTIDLKSHTKTQRPPRGPKVASKRVVVSDSEDSDLDLKNNKRSELSATINKQNLQRHNIEHFGDEKTAAQSSLPKLKEDCGLKSVPIHEHSSAHGATKTEEQTSKLSHHGKINAQQVQKVRRIEKQVIKSRPSARTRDSGIPINPSDIKPNSTPKHRLPRQHGDAPKKNTKLRRRNIRQQSPFLNVLPGEIRNLVYQYVIPDARIMVFATSPKAEIAEAQKLWVNQGVHIKQPRSRLYSLMDRKQLENGVQVSGAMLLVSRQVSREVQHFLYSRTTFCFPSLNVLCKFVREAPKQGIDCIENVELESGTYGEPYLTRNRIFKVRYDRKWRKVCDILGLQMKSLARLELYSHSVEWPAGKIEQTEWHKALMQVVQLRKLRDAKIQLTNPWFSNKRIVHIRHKIEQSMMTVAGQQEREDKEHQRCLRLIQKAEEAEAARRAKSAPVKCLKITLGSGTAAAADATISGSTDAI